MRPSLLPLCCAVLLLGAAGAHAEKADREKEIVVGADHLVADDAKKSSVFEGNVVVTQGSMRMTAEKVTVREDAERHKYYVATGSPVTFRQKLDNSEEWVEGYAQRSEFDDLTDVLRLYDRALVKRNQNELTGDFISYDMRRELAEVTGGPPGTPRPAGSRVKAVILPPPRKGEDKSKADDKPKAGAAPAVPATAANAPALNPPLELKADPGKS